MTRTQALEISDALVDLGQTHTIVVGVTDNYNPRERYTVNVTPALTFSSMDITALQRIADRLDCGIAFCAGSFTFTEVRA